MSCKAPRTRGWQEALMSQHGLPIGSICLLLRRANRSSHLLVQHLPIARLSGLVYFWELPPTLVHLSFSDAAFRAVDDLRLSTGDHIVGSEAGLVDWLFVHEGILRTRIVHCPHELLVAAPGLVLHEGGKLRALLRLVEDWRWIAVHGSDLLFRWAAYYSNLGLQLSLPLERALPPVSVADRLSRVLSGNGKGRVLQRELGQSVEVGDGLIAHFLGSLDLRGSLLIQHVLVLAMLLLFGVGRSLATKLRLFSSSELRVVPFVAATILHSTIHLVLRRLFGHLTGQGTLSLVGLMTLVLLHGLIELQILLLVKLKLPLELQQLVTVHLLAKEYLGLLEELMLSLQCLSLQDGILKGHVGLIKLLVEELLQMRILPSCIQALVDRHGQLDGLVCSIRLRPLHELLLLLHGEVLLRERHWVLIGLLLLSHLSMVVEAQRIQNVFPGVSPGRACHS